MHPSREVTKEYYAKVKGFFKKLERKVKVEDCNHQSQKIKLQM